MGEVEASAERFAIEGVQATSSAIGLAVFATYEELEFIASQYSAARIGLASGLYRALPTLGRDADRLASDAGRVAKAAVLLEREPDEERQRALQQVWVLATRRLARDIDDFLESCEAGTQQGKMEYPGNWSAIAAEFTDLQHYRGAKDPTAVATAARQILSKIQWCSQHANYLVAKTAGLDVDRPSNRKKDRRGDED